MLCQIRLNALGLLCDSPRTTEPVTEIDLQLLQLFIPPNMNNQAPSFRQQAEAHLKKVMSEDGHLLLLLFAAAKGTPNVASIIIKKMKLFSYPMQCTSCQHIQLQMT